MARSTHLHRTVQGMSRTITGETARRIAHRIVAWASNIEPGASNRMGAWELHASNLAREMLAKRR